MIAANARDRFGALIATGLAAMMVFHVFVNVGMTIGIMPVTGIPCHSSQREARSISR